MKKAVFYNTQLFTRNHSQEPHGFDQRRVAAAARPDFNELKFFLSPVGAVERAIPDRFGDVRGEYLVAVLQVGDSSADL